MFFAQHDARQLFKLDQQIFGINLRAGGDMQRLQLPFFELVAGMDYHAASNWVA